MNSATRSGTTSARGRVHRRNTSPAPRPSPGRGRAGDVHARLSRWPSRRGRRCSGSTPVHTVIALLVDAIEAGCVNWKPRRPTWRDGNAEANGVSSVPTSGIRVMMSSGEQMAAVQGQRATRPGLLPLGDRSGDDGVVLLGGVAVGQHLDRQAGVSPNAGRLATTADTGASPAGWMPLGNPTLGRVRHVEIDALGEVFCPAPATYATRTRSGVWAAGRPDAHRRRRPAPRRRPGRPPHDLVP